MDEDEILQKAMQNVAMRNLEKELRDAIAFGPKILGDIYAEYQKLSEKKDENSSST